MDQFVLVLTVEIVIRVKKVGVLLSSIVTGGVMQTEYNTRMVDGVWVCSCPHYRFRGTYCRHILQRLLDLRGKVDGVRDSSLDAYMEIISDPSSLNDRYQDILVAVDEMGVPVSDYEIAEHLSYEDPNKVRPRRFELVNKYYKPFLEEKGKRECKRTGKRVFVWGLTKQGELLVGDLKRVLN